MDLNKIQKEKKGTALNNKKDESIINEFKYRKNGSNEYYYTETEIKNYRLYQKRQILENNMLGKFNSKGNYVLDLQIIDELIKMKKVIVTEDENLIFVDSFTAFPEIGKLKFSVSIKKMNDKYSKMVAELNLYETIKNIDEKKNLEQITKIAIYEGMSSESFKDEVFNLFNIIKDNDVAILEDISNFEAIISRIKISKGLSGEYFNVNLLELEKKYYESRLEILKNPEYYAVLQKFKRKINYLMQNVNATNPKYYLLLNLLLDEAIEEFLKMESETSKKLRKELEQITIEHYIKDKELRQKAMAILIEKQNNEKTQNQAIKKTQSGKSKGKGKPKKNAKKSAGKKGKPKIKKDGSQVKKVEKKKALKIKGNFSSSGLGKNNFSYSHNSYNDIYTEYERLR